LKQRIDVGCSQQECRRKKNSIATSRLCSSAFVAMVHHSIAYDRWNCRRVTPSARAQEREGEFQMRLPYPRCSGSLQFEIEQEGVLAAPAASTLGLMVGPSIGDGRQRATRRSVVRAPPILICSRCSYAGTSLSGRDQIMGHPSLNQTIEAESRQLAEGSVIAAWASNRTLGH
jgi:hypothetical protein